jgi:glutamate-1-semialdehyde 2,1-aminomutase
MGRRLSSVSKPDTGIYLRALDSIAQGALTNSKRAECMVKGVYPTHLREGRGCYVWDTRGNRYIDFICGLGSNLLGYGHSEVSDTIARRAQLGCTLSLGTDIEVILAEKLKEHFPGVERVKLLKTGSEACSAAIRIARAFTKRKLVLSEGYHGWHEEFVSLTPPALGTTEHPWIQKLTDLAQITHEVAAVIVEPVMTDFSEERIQWLRELRTQTERLGVVLIFDEIITGFRVPKFSIANYLGINPDLLCLGKAMANGSALSALGGSAAIMNCDEYFVSSTFSGETTSIAAALKVISLLHNKYALEQLWERGAYFQKEFNKLWPDGVTLKGYPTRAVFQGNPRDKALLWQEACRAGILFGPSWFLSFAHLENLELVLNTCRDIVTRICSGNVELMGEMPTSPFAQRVREST